MDDQLEMLQRQLMAVQEQKTNPLSQRTVAQIMLKLQKNNFQFFATTDGNEYITPECLDKEIIQISKQRGKINISILPQILNINIETIEARISIITSKSTIIQHNQFLLTKEQILSLISRLKQKLSSQGKIDLDQIAVLNQYNIAFVKKIVEENIQQLHAQLINNQLITKQYSQIQKSKIKGYLNSISKPISIETLVKNASLQNINIQQTIQQLIKNQQITGKCQNGYFIPNKFCQNQKKIINTFFQNNGYVQFSLLNKNFINSKHKQWLDKNLQGEYIIFQNVCIKKLKLQGYQHQISSLLKGEGFVQINSIIPFQLEDQKILQFLKQYCNINNFTYNEGYCYSEEWLEKCTMEFKEIILYNIFFKKNQESKKKSKKNIQRRIITQQQLVETLFDAGLAQYSVLGNISGFLLPILSQRLQQLKNKLQKQLSKSKGIISSGFLKYKRCKTILKNEQNLIRFLNTIQKNKKKYGKWQDQDFGISQKDKSGKYSLVNFDGTIYKTWKQIDNLKWLPYDIEKLKEPYHLIKKSQFMNKLLLAELIQIILKHNQATQNKIDNPILQKYLTNQPPFVYRFYTGINQPKYVLIDDQIPYVNDNIFGIDGYYSLIQKAYAKFRYCYKSLLSIGFQQLILQISGKISQKYKFEKQTIEKTCEAIKISLQNGNCVILIGEGQGGKNIVNNGVQTQFKNQKPYLLKLIDGQINIFPYKQSEYLKMKIEEIQELFKNIYIF